MRLLLPSWLEEREKRKKRGDGVMEGIYVLWRFFSLWVGSFFFFYFNVSGSFGNGPPALLLIMVGNIHRMVSK